KRPVKEVKRERAEITEALLKMLPVLNGKSLCMKYLSRIGCPSRRDGCFSKDRGHFCPDRLPSEVRDVIICCYGGF
ncbi:hypothetical protein PHYSODRAFT_464980, partial [Phytophthora sojae]